MAKAALNLHIIASGSAGGPVTYQVPGGKYLVGKAFQLGNPSSGFVYVTPVDTGVAIQIGAAQNSSGIAYDVGPIMLNAGDILSGGTQGSFGFSGFLYDVA